MRVGEEKVDGVMDTNLDEGCRLISCKDTRVGLGDGDPVSWINNTAICRSPICTFVLPKQQP